jgi:hypothetical protein
LQPTSPDYGRVSAALAYLCLHLPEILDALGEDTASVERLRSLLVAVGRVDRDALAEAVDAVHLALRTRGDAVGLYGHSRNLDLAGVTGFEIVYRCPLHLCNGCAAGEVDHNTAHCTLSGRPLLRERLD